MKTLPLIAALLLAGLTSLAQAQTFRVGLAEDPDVLDPTLARSFVGRVVFAALCDKLFDIDEKLNIVPQLAESYSWSADSKALTLKLRAGVSFHDGEKFDAAAVKFNIERHKTMAGSNRRGELAPVSTVDVVDPMTVRLNLSAPFSPLLAALSDRAGMMVSPKAAHRGRRQVRPEAGVLGPVQVRRAGGAGPHHAGAFRRLLAEGRGQLREADLHADPRRHGAAGQPEVGPARLHRTRRLVGHREAQDRQEAEDRQHHRDRLPGHHDQPGQERQGQAEPAGPRRQGARGLRARARPPGPGPGGDGQRGDGGQPVGGAEQPVLREERAGAQARRGQGAGAAEGSRRAEPQLHAADRHHVATRSGWRWWCRR